MDESCRVCENKINSTGISARVSSLILICFILYTLFSISLVVSNLHQVRSHAQKHFQKVGKPDTMNTELTEQGEQSLEQEDRPHQRRKLNIDMLRKVLVDLFFSIIVQVLSLLFVIVVVNI
jgi:hypothetical protein